MSRSSYSVNKDQQLPFGNPDPFLVIEKSLEINGQRWCENISLIEELLVQIVRKLGTEYPQMRATFVVRRLPNFMVPFTNKNEYAIVLDRFDFSLVPHDQSGKSSTDKGGKPNLRQVEIFLPRKNTQSLSINGRKGHNADKDGKNEFEEVEADENEHVETMTDCNVFLNAYKAYYSHEVFKAFATAFSKISQALSDTDEKQHSSDSDLHNECSADTAPVQLIEGHLLKDLKCNPEVDKIFRVAQPHLRICPSLKIKIKTSVNHLKSFISITYGDTEVFVRPALFYEHGYHRVNANLTERIPLYHAGILTIGESLLKGCLLFPTSFETLWTLQFWPSESHVLCLFHPSSIMIRLYKMYSAFGLNPVHFYETVNHNFMVGMEDLDSLLPEDRSKLLSMDYIISSFLYELEEFPNVEEWAPRNFTTRLLHLFRQAIDAFDKGFHGHYFTKTNVLRGLWRNSMDDCNRDEKSALKELDDIRESPDDVDDYKDMSFIERNDLEDEFGLRFEELDLDDDDDRDPARLSKSPPRLTSDLVYPSVNPFETGSKDALTGKESTRGTKSLSRLLGSNFLKKLGGSRPNSEAGTLSKKSPPHTMRSIADVASEFEKSIAQQRDRPSLFPFPISGQEGQVSDTSFSRQNLFINDRPQPGTSHAQQYDNDAFEEGSVLGQPESIYYTILQSIKDLPPADSATDPEVRGYIEKMKRALETQEELIVSWGKTLQEVPKPKFICPHAFTSRQIQYLSRVIHVVSRCSPSTIKIVRSSKLPSWEISGDILRIVLHQMRSESQLGPDPGGMRKRLGQRGEQGHEQEAIGNENRPKKSLSFKLISKRPSLFKSFKRDGGNDPCKLNDHDQRYNGDHELGPEEEMQLALEDPETAATQRLLQWLWQLRTSEIGRLSMKANKYLEALYDVSMANSHFLEQSSEEKVFETLAVRSAVAVTKIMETDKFHAHIPLSTASKKGWLWAEMVMWLASWNQERGVSMKALVPVMDHNSKTYLVKNISPTPVDIYGTIKKTNPLDPEPDLEAVTLAFHSELSPAGWNDIEDPSQPGPFTVPLLIFSSLSYYKLWEVIPGNLVHALVRLQKFNVNRNTLQHVGNLLSHPHRKTALNEVRKLNKTTSFRIHHFENNIMSKTFKRLASIRNTRKKAKSTGGYLHCLTCEQVGCSLQVQQGGAGSSVSVLNGREIECTKF